MDKLQSVAASFTGGDGSQTSDPLNPGDQPADGSHDQAAGGGLIATLGDKISSITGSGGESGKKEEGIGEGVGQGTQGGDSAAGQAKDEQISDFLRDKYKSTADPTKPTQ